MGNAEKVVSRRIVYLPVLDLEERGTRGLKT